MDRRLLASSMVLYRYKDRPGLGLMSTVPGIVPGSRPAGRPRSVVISGTGPYHDAKFSTGRPEGSISMTSMRGLPAIPADVAKKLGLRDGGQIDWYLAAAPGRPIRVQIRAGPRRQRKKGTAKRRGALSRIVLAETGRRGGVQMRTHLNVPSPVARFMGLDGSGHVRISGTGSYRTVMPCGPDDHPTMAAYRTTNSSGYYRYLLHPPAGSEAEKYAARGGLITWIAAADGLGYWEVGIRHNPAPAKV